MPISRVVAHSLFVFAFGATVPAGATGDGKVTHLPIESLQAVNEVYSRLKNDYVEPLDDKTLVRHCVAGMVRGADPHSSYLDENEFKGLKAGSRPRGGIGVELSMKDDLVQIVSAIEDTPAWRSGLRGGDVILKIDDINMQGRSLNEAVKLLRGDPGVPVTLSVARSRENRPLAFTVTRADIRIQSVKSRLLGDGYGYFRIVQFNTNSGKEFKQAIHKLRSEYGRPLRGAVLDLRGNPGGILNVAIEVADSLLDSGIILYTVGRDRNAEMKFSATAGDVLQRAPMAVLVDGATAAGSEVLAGALQDHKRAVILGTRTFGRGSIQTVIALADGGALKLTTSRWRTPNGRLVQGAGIKPDIQLPMLVTEPVSRLARVDRDPLVEKALTELQQKASNQ